MIATYTCRSLCLFAACLVLLLPASVLAAEEAAAPPAMFPDFADAPGLGDFLGEGGGEGEMTLSGSFKVQRGQRSGVLEIRAALAPQWHVYALDQQGGPGPAKITVPPSGPVRVTGPFQPDKPPEVRKVEVFDVPLREHYGQVTWSAPIELASDADVEKTRFEAVFDGQICSDNVGCKPIFGEKIEIAFGGYLDGATAARTESAVPAKLAVDAFSPPASLAEYRGDRAHVALRGHAEPSTVAAGGKLKLVISAVPDADWHLYAYAAEDPQQVAKPTLIALSEPAPWTLDAVTASEEPIVKAAEGDQPEVRYHEGAVTWTAQLTLPPDTPDGDYDLAGIFGYQTCTDTSCDRPLAAKFTAKVTVGEAAGTEPVPLAFTDARYAEAAQLAAAHAQGGASAATPPPVAADSKAAPPQSADSPPPSSPNGQTPLPLVLVYAFLGGLILNVMPCVLPVIGLKVMAFVQQAGESRAKVLALNIWYSLGLMSVFLLLATLATVWNVGWGQQFSSETVTITLAAIVFAMGLSFLGVWQMPIPGFVGSASAAELAEKEGPAGAFMKGVLTTILATPCSGPGVAVALGYCTGKPASVVYMIFAMVGLGMASPYLVIGVFPRALRLLPKPGAWMERFEQAMGLVLLATVIYLLSFTAWANVLPAVTLLLGLGAACWWIGQIPFTADFHVKVRGWIGATAFVVLCGLFAFTGKTTIRGSEALGLPGEVYGLRGIMEYRLERYVAQQAALHGTNDDLLDSPEITQHTTAIRWLPYSEQQLQRLIAANRTVLVDFTADWCLTCKTLEATVLDTQEVRDALRANGVVALQADWTNGDPEISRKLESLGSKQVPVVAIFPAGRAKQPIVLAGFYTKGTLLEKLQDAGPSATASAPRGADVGLVHSGVPVL
jgi:suppressor for copper-sensitivity B